MCQTSIRKSSSRRFLLEIDCTTFELNRRLWYIVQDVSMELAPVLLCQWLWICQQLSKFQPTYFYVLFANFIWFCVCGGERVNCRSIFDFPKLIYPFFMGFPNRREMLSTWSLDMKLWQIGGLQFCAFPTPNEYEKFLWVDGEQNKSSLDEEHPLFNSVFFDFRQAPKPHVQWPILCAWQKIFFIWLNAFQH